MQPQSRDETSPSPRRKPSALPAVLNREQRLDRHQVTLLLGVRATKFYTLLRSGKFPAAERFSPRCHRWPAGVVLDWLAARELA